MKNSGSIDSLLVRVADDDSGAFTRLFDMYLPQVIQIAGYFIKSDELCQEVASDVFLNLWNNRRKLKDVSNFNSYIFILTRNKAFDYLDKQSRYPEFLPVSIEIQTTASNPEDTLLQSEVEHLVTESLNNLPARCREIFIMAREQGLTYHQIAKILSISEKTVNAQMVTAIKRMSEILRKYILVMI